MEKKEQLPCLALSRPLAFIDIEATGTNPRVDRIVELAIVMLTPQRSRSSHVFRVNPGIPIPPEATAIHGITDADVKDSPPFAAISGKVADILEDADLCGYNILRFDLPLLEEEFHRAGFVFDPEKHRIVDAQRIFHQKEPRDLTAALSFYCRQMHLNAHSAESDAIATMMVLEGQLRRYPDLPRDVEGLDRYCNPRDSSWVDRTGKLRWSDGEIVLNFGRKKGAPLKEIIAKDRGLIEWMLRQEFPRDTQEIIKNALEGKWPKPPPPTES